MPQGHGQYSRPRAWASPAQAPLSKRTLASPCPALPTCPRRCPLLSSTPSSCAHASWSCAHLRPGPVCTACLMHTALTPLRTSSRAPSAGHLPPSPGHAGSRARWGSPPPTCPSPPASAPRGETAGLSRLGAGGARPSGTPGQPLIDARQERHPEEALWPSRPPSPAASGRPRGAVWDL